MPQLKKIKFKVNGLHCKSCKTLLETEIDILPGVDEVMVNYQTGDCFVEFDESLISFGEIKNKIEKFDYSVIDSSKKQETMIKNHPQAMNGKKKFFIGLAIPFIFLLLLVGYFLFQYYGGFKILAKLNEPNLGYGLILLIGFLASFHCVGMCGGLVVTYSAGITAQGNKKIKITLPHFQYNFGRLVSYTIIGGILGGIGSFFAINPYFSGTLMIIAGIFMILMAISLFTNYRWLDKVKLKTPQSIAKYIYKQKQTQKPKSPLIIGLLTGLMPCGPLQAMQLYALGSGSFSRGALSMAAYALGTIPLMFGFGTFISYLSKNYMKKIMKISAIIVGLLALIMIGRGLTNFGFNLSLAKTNSNQPLNTTEIDSAKVQTIKMDLDYRGYNPNVLYAKEGIPVRWIINVKQMSGCTNEIILHGGYNIRKKLQYGENVIEFIPTKAGKIEFSCWMQMVWGKFIVQ